MLSVDKLLETSRSVVLDAFAGGSAAKHSTNQPTCRSVGSMAFHSPDGYNCHNENGDEDDNGDVVDVKRYYHK